MNDGLAPQVMIAIQEHYKAAVNAAESNYESSVAEEDSITGALGQAMEGTQIVQVDNVSYRVRTTYRKFRGRGPGALEKRTGADGIFQIEVRDSEGSITYQKGLLFQAKNDWSGLDSNLLAQTSRLSKMPNGGIAINYTPRGYFAARAESIVQAEGNRSHLPENSELPLAEILADSFVPCKIGIQGMYYDAVRRILYLPNETVQFRGYRFIIDHRIRTVVSKRGRKFHDKIQSPWIF